MRWIVAIAALALGAVLPGQEAVEAAAMQSKPGLEEALQALASVDTAKLHSDQAYAKATLANLDAAMPAAGRDPEIVANFQLMRATALATLGRNAEAVAAARKATAAQPGDGSIQAEAVFQAARAEQPTASVELLDAATRSVRDSNQRALLRQGLSEELVFWLRRQLYAAKARPVETRLTNSLLALQWPSPERAGMLDGFRQTAIKARLPGDVAGARTLLAEMTDPASILPLLVSRRFDALFASDAERLARLDTAIRAYDKGSAERLRLKPDDLDLLLDRAQFLRAVGRDQEALALLTPWAEDMERVEREGEKGFWLVNEAAYALVALGRADEGADLMEKLIALDLDKHPYLISMAINHGELLYAAGRYAASARYAEALFATGKAGASAYGRMWMWSSAACGHLRAGDPARAAPWMERLEAGSDDNPSAHIEALLCADDLDSAEPLLLKRLQSEDVEEVLVDLQDYTLGRSGTDPALARSMAALRSRPAVAAAVARRGRILRLPLSRVFFTDY